jgi:hypothetical protein
MGIIRTMIMNRQRFIAAASVATIGRAFWFYRTEALFAGNIENLNKSGGSHLK